jgi:chromosome segregation ATPase
MARESGVTYEAVRAACCELLADGQNPTRPAVQAALARPERLGFKGSNSVVQGFVTQFKAEMARLAGAPERTVAGVPDAFVAAQDRMLVEMVAIAREIATAELAEREAALVAARHEMDAAITAARTAAEGAEQLRLRAEGELTAVHGQLAEARHALQARSTEFQALEGAHHALQSEVAVLRQAVAHGEARVVDAQHALEAAEHRHQAEKRDLAVAADAERARILTQLDETRQRAQRASKLAAATLADAETRAHTSGLQAEALTRELATVREALAAAEARNALLGPRVAALEAALGVAQQANHGLERDKLTLTLRAETSEAQRQDAHASWLAAEGELARLRGLIEAQAHRDRNTPPSSESGP